MKLVSGLFYMLPSHSCLWFAPPGQFFSNARSKKCRCLTACLPGKKQDVLCLQNFPSRGHFLTGPLCSPRYHMEGTRTRVLPQASSRFDSTAWLCKFRNSMCLLHSSLKFICNRLNRFYSILESSTHKHNNSTREGKKVTETE